MEWRSVIHQQRREPQKILSNYSWRGRTSSSSREGLRWLKGRRRAGTGTARAFCPGASRGQALISVIDPPARRRKGDGRNVGERPVRGGARADSLRLFSVFFSLRSMGSPALNSPGCQTPDVRHPPTGGLTARLVRARKDRRPRICAEPRGHGWKDLKVGVWNLEPDSTAWIEYAVPRTPQRSPCGGGTAPRLPARCRDRERPAPCRGPPRRGPAHLFPGDRPVPASLDLENHVWSVEHNPESIEHVTTEQDVRLFRTGHDFDHSEVVLTSRDGAMEF
jgi:hypothetical protein